MSERHANYRVTISDAGTVVIRRHVDPDGNVVGAELMPSPLDDAHRYSWRSDSIAEWVTVAGAGARDA